jgi:hypothetical protein
MADKGFQLKVIVPTDDGFNISDKGIEKASYYLMYNISNRSYQLAGKIKSTELFESSEFDFTIFKSEIEKANVDKIICIKQSELKQGIDVTVVSEKEIGIVLNYLIDIIDKKES